MPPTEPEINSIAGCPIKCADIRERLSSSSWWMRLRCQRVAQRANHEEQESGRFFQDRYRATRLVDEASLLACAGYVDLNPFRAAMCQTLESSDHTAVQRRIAAIANQEDSEIVVAAADELHDSSKSALPKQSAGDSFLAPLTIDERHAPIGPCASQGERRGSDKVFCRCRWKTIWSYWIGQHAKLRRACVAKSPGCLLTRAGFYLPVTRRAGIAQRRLLNSSISHRMQAD